MRLRHLQSTRWVVRLLTVQVALLCVRVLAGLLVLDPVSVLPPLLQVLLVGWLRHAFVRQHRWAWAGLVALTVLDAGLLLVSGPVWAVAGHAVLLGLLLHPDAREWVRPGP
ncbi:hypothetical protein [Klenkia taihuensis]|uniref:hypothetical protein n=1 Tax=Klenkia taihuensis TaxID=1225127 RepID=UPI000B815A67|nr:hypothetical protein [Klenkia taihuensis]GHE08637.1 hypothetical protein GCM10011381_09880 [Klenkia taihuensis]